MKRDGGQTSDNTREMAQARAQGSKRRDISEGAHGAAEVGQEPAVGF